MSGSESTTPRRVAITGTPGAGKTTAAERLAEEFDVDVVHLNDLVREEELWTERDVKRDTLVADIDGLRERLGDWTGVVESHLAHYLEADAVVVLRCEPAVLESRLRDRGEPEATARENAESEALDVVLSEAVDRHGQNSVHEVETTDRSPGDVAGEVAAVLRGERQPGVGTVDYLSYVR